MPDQSHHANALLHEALNYAAKNLRVFPCAPRKKTPLLPRQPWQQYATTDPTQITQWYARSPQANIAVAMGPHPTLPPESWILDFDADSDEAVDLVVETLFQGIDLHTPQFKGQRGRHFLFRWTDQLPNNTHANWKIHSADGTRGLIDVKAGNGKGSYCIFPPSIHPDGPTYAWLPGRSPDDCPPMSIPPEVLERIRHHIGLPSTTTDQGKPTPPTVRKARPPHYWQDLLKGVSEGGRNNAAISLAGKWMSEIDITNPQALEERHREFLHWNERNVPPLAPMVVEATWHNALALETRSRQQRNKQTAQTQLETWRAVRVNADPPKWKLFGPLWEGFVELSLDQWLNAAHVEKQALRQKGVSFDYGFGSLWSGNRKERRGLRQKLADAATTEEPSFEECRDRVVAHLIWSQHLDHALSADEPHSAGRPCRLADGSLWFKTEYLLTNGGSLKDYPERNEINAVLRECGVSDRTRRFGARWVKFRVLSAAGVRALEALARKGAIEG